MNHVKGRIITDKGKKQRATRSPKPLGIEKRAIVPVKERIPRRKREMPRLIPRFIRD